MQSAKQNFKLRFELAVYRFERVKPDPTLIAWMSLKLEHVCSYIWELVYPLSAIPLCTYTRLCEAKSYTYGSPYCKHVSIFYVSKESFQLFNHWINDNQYQRTYKVEEISQKHYAK